MAQLRKHLLAATAGLLLLAPSAGTSFAATGDIVDNTPGAVELAHGMPGHHGGYRWQQGCPGMMGLGWGDGAGHGYGPGSRYDMGPGMMGRGMGGQGMMAPGMGGQGMMSPGMGGQGMMGPGMGGQGMMGPGMGGQGMMGPGMGGQGMMGPGMGGQGMMGPGMGLGQRVVPSKDLSTDDVRHFLEHRLEMHGNKRLKVGEVKESDEEKIIADITTVDGSLVQRLEVDRHTGQMEHIE